MNLNGSVGITLKGVYGTPHRVWVYLKHPGHGVLEHPIFNSVHNSKTCLSLTSTRKQLETPNFHHNAHLLTALVVSGSDRLQDERGA